MHGNNDGHDGMISRRDAGRWLIAAAGLGVASTAFGQPAKQPIQQKKKKSDPAASNPQSTPPGAQSPLGPPAQPNAPGGPSFLDKLVTRGREREYILKVMIVIDGYQTPVSHIRTDQMPTIVELAFQSAAIVFPVIRGCASSKTHVDDVKGVMSFDDKPEDTTPTYNEGYPCGTRLGRWELHDKRGRQASLQLEIPMTVWETVFDEAAANSVPWPKAGWGPVQMTTFDRQLFIDREQPPMSDAVDRWCEGKDPKSIPPVQLAKFLAGKVVEAIQPNGVNYVSSRAGAFSGLDIRGAAATLADGRGNEHEIACVLAGLYRNAGLPARVVIGHDLSETRGQRATVFDRAIRGGPRLRSWVEFGLYDEINQKEIWVPVDPVRIRQRSSRMQPLDQPWPFFGANRDTEDVMPFAFQYHPPTSVFAQGAVAFWGWITLPETQAARQWLDFTAIRTPRRGDDDTK